MAQAIPAKAKSAWSPLAVPLFRAIWVATVISNIGTWAQEAGGPWLMTLLKQGSPVWVSRVAVAESLPICVLTILAGALSDGLDRRKFLIFTQIWMLTASGLLGVLTLLGLVSPGILLLLTAVLGVGIALSGPPFQAIVPELVPPGDMPLAVALNSVALNVARAIGPALGMAVILMAGGGIRGSSASFFVNSASFLGVAYVLWKWNRPAQKGTAHAEQLWQAIKLGFVYTRHSPALICILIRVAAFIACAVAMWAQLPVISQRLGVAAGGYGTLMAFLGVGAVIGVIFMPKIQAMISIDLMVALCTANFAVGLILLGLVHDAAPAYLLMLFLGFNWVIVPTNFNVATQRSAPLWVKGRALAMYLTTLFGSWAVGSAIWGHVAERYSISTALIAAGILMLAGLLLLSRFRLTLAAGHDFSPAFGPKGETAPALPGGLSPTADGLFEIHFEWPSHIGTHEFKPHVRELRRQRLRNGAAEWQLGRVEDTAVETWRETVRFHAESGLAQLHSRTTRSDVQLHEHIRAGRPLPENATPENAAPEKNPFLVWIAGSVYYCLDRILDETEKTLRRLESMKDQAH